MYFPNFIREINLQFVIGFLLLSLLVHAMYDIFVALKEERSRSSRCRLCFLGIWFFVLSVLTYACFSPLTFIRLISRIPNFPTTEEIERQSAKIARRSEDTFTTRYDSKGLELTQIDSGVEAIIPIHCGYTQTELNELDPTSAAYQVNALVATLRLSDEELVAKFKALSHGKKDSYPSIRWEKKPVFIVRKIRQCTIQTLANFGEFARPAKNAVLRQLERRPDMLYCVKPTVNAMGTKTSAADVDLLFILLYHQDAGVKHFASRLILQLEAEAIPQLVENLHSKNPDTLIYSLQTLRKFGNSAANASERVVELINFPLARVQGEALKTLVTIADEYSMVEQLVLEALNKQDSDTILATLNVLKETPVRTARVVEALNALFQDSHSHGNSHTHGIRTRIILSLGEIGELAAPVLANIAYQVYHEELLLPDSKRDSEQHTSDKCSIHNEYDYGTRSSKTIVKCHNRTPKPQARRYREPRMFFCSNPLPRSRLPISKELSIAIPLSGVRAVNHLVDRMDTVSPGYRALVITSLLSLEREQAKDLAEQILSSEIDKEYPWNQVSMVKLAARYSITDAKTRLQTLMSNKSFTQCMKEKHFMEYYTSLGAEVLE